MIFNVFCIGIGTKGPDDFLFWHNQQHASPHHLHMTNRRFFIGPIPDGWLQHHRKSWYKTGIKFKNYSSKTVSFSADPVVVHYEDDTPETDNDPSSSGPEQEDNQNGDWEDEETQDEQDNEPNGEGPSQRSEDVDTTSRRTGKSMATPTTETGAPPPKENGSQEQTN